MNGWLLAAMTALLVARPLFPSESAAAQGDGLPMVMLWLAVAVLWLAGAIGRRQFVFRFGPVDAAVLLLVAWQCISAGHAVGHGSPRPALNMLWEWVGLGLVFFLARQLVYDARAGRAVVAAMIALMAGMSVYGIYQGAVELPALQRQFLDNPEGMLHAAELDLPAGSPLREVLWNRLKNSEPTGPFLLTNSLAAALAPWLAIGLGIVAATWRHRRRSIAWLICLVPMALCLLLTKSRSGYAAIAVGIVCLAVGRFRLRWIAIAAALAGALAVAVVIGGLAKPAAATSFSYRLQYWQATLYMIADRPLWGCGPGNFQDVYTRYRLPEASEEVADPHDFLLEVWATAGTPALLSLLGTLGLFAFFLTAHGPPDRGPLFGPDQASEPQRGASRERCPSPCGSSSPQPETKGATPQGLRRWARDLSSHAPREPAGTPAKVPPDAVKHVWKFVLGGLIGGFLLSIPLGEISSAPPSNFAVIIGLPVAAACMLLLVPWVRDGAFSPALAGVGVAVLLVDLLTTGGIGMPGIAQSLWLLLALGLGGAWPRTAPRIMAIVLLLVGLGLSIACHQTSYARVLACQSFQRLARREYFDGHRQSALNYMRQAVAADPYSSDAHAFLAEIYLDSWLARPDLADYEAFEAEDALARRMAPEAAPIWRASADRHRRAFAKTDAAGRCLQPRAIEQAVEIARQTVQLYPASGSDRAALAMICHLAGDEQSYRREAMAALELDRRMLHEDKKLPPSLRRELEHVLGATEK